MQTPLQTILVPDQHPASQHLVTEPTPAQVTTEGQQESVDLLKPHKDVLPLDKLQHPHCGGVFYGSLPMKPKVNPSQ